VRRGTTDADEGATEAASSTLAWGQSDANCRRRRSTYMATAGSRKWRMSKQAAPPLQTRCPCYNPGSPRPCTSRCPGLQTHAYSSVTVNNCRLLSVTASYCQLLPVAVNYCQFPPVTASYCQLLTVPVTVAPAIATTDCWQARMAFAKAFSTKSDHGRELYSSRPSNDMIVSHALASRCDSQDISILH
jgi:hypothetical protein